MALNDQNIKMKTTATLLLLFAACVSCRFHKLTLKDDPRKLISLTSFGFLSGGTLTVNITLFSKELFSTSEISENSAMFGLALEKMESDVLSYMDDMLNKCDLTQTGLFFTFDFQEEKLKIKRVGSDMERLLVSDQKRTLFLTAHNLNRRDSDRGDMDSRFSDQHYLRGNRSKLQSVEDTVEPALISDEHEEPQTYDKPAASSNTPQPAKPSPTVAAPPSPSSTPPSSSLISQPPDAGINSADNATPNRATSPPQTLTSGGKLSVSNWMKTSSQDMNQETELYSVDLKRAWDGSYRAYFLVHIRRPEEEGRYSLVFHNCPSYRKDAGAQITLTMEIAEDNNGNFLSAGEMPLPALNFTFSVVYFIAAVAWWFLLRRSPHNVYTIHRLMLAVVFVKSFACLFHGINMYYIQIKGIREDSLVILWYIVSEMREVLMFVTVLLIGTGWGFIKHVLTGRDKIFFWIVIPLQVLNRVAEVMVQERERWNESYTTWKDIFVLVDLLCCGAVLFRILWTYRHFKKVSCRDGTEGGINQQKLRLLVHYYIVVVCYVYLTRMVAYLLKMALPFRLVWLTDLLQELAMLVFFVVTGSRLCPATDNPYLQVPQDCGQDEPEMEEVLTKTGATENMVRVSQKMEVDKLGKP
ncbi:protein GPR107-like [Babylonia areolata]|uniref:protein GPR107-like n=1 Tax=Babylonia areolata TaxID=304850 RepID=UPI003FD32ECB